MDRAQLERFDNQGMHKMYDNWPKIAVNAYESSLKQTDYKDISHIVFAGMGGSGAINDVFSSILSKTKIHVSSIKSHIIPNSVNSDTLVVTTSISGNTMETLSILDSAKKLGCKIISFSSGGKMEQFCNEYGIEYRNIPMIHSPRASFVSFFYSMLKVLEPVIPIRNSDVKESLNQLEKTGNEISSSNLTQINPALDLAFWITKIPLVYYPQGLYASALRFKNSLQENAKMHVMIEEIGEACHNGIVSWEIPSNVQPILVQGRDDHIQTKRRWKIFKRFFDERDIDYKEVFSTDGSLLTKLINLNYFLDYSTIYRAVLSKIEPSQISAINYIKERLQ
jgi:glucose/mannose-6-phosphate isomerase